MKSKLYAKFYLLIFYHISILYSGSNATAQEEYSGDDFLDVNFKIEPTPVLVKGPTSATYSLKWVRGPYNEDLPEQGHEGSGRGKRDYTLEDFLIWMPSGDGPIRKVKKHDWSTHYTETIYVTKTTTIYTPPSAIETYPTEKGIFQTKATTNYEKAFSGRRPSESKCNIFHDTYPNFRAKFNISTQESYHNRTNKNGRHYHNKPKNALHTQPYNQATKLKYITTTPSLSIYPDIKEFLHSSLGYEGPSTLLYHYSTPIYQTPELPTSVIDSSSSKISDFAPVWKTQSSHFQTTCSSGCVSLSTTQIPTNSFSRESVSWNWITNQSFSPDIVTQSTIHEEISTPLSSTKESKEPDVLEVIYSTTSKDYMIPSLLFTSKIPTTFPTSKSSTTDQKFHTTSQSILDIDSTPIHKTSHTLQKETPDSTSTTIFLTTHSSAQPYIKTENTESQHEHTTSATNWIIDTNFTSKSTTPQLGDEICNCTRATSIPKFTFRVPDTTITFSSVTPSPSNNATIPMDKLYWIRTVVSGLPKTNDTTIFKKEMTKKLTKAYRYAYELSSIKSREDNLVRKSNKIAKQTLLREKRTINKSMRYFTLFNKDYITEARRPLRNIALKVLTRTKRQDSSNISVRIQNITYKDEENITEVVYSLFVGDIPLIAKEAVEKMKKVNDTLLENILEYTLDVKAEEYLQPEKLVERTGNYNVVMLAFLVIISTAFCFLMVFIIYFVYKRKKKKASQSTANLRQGSQSYLQSPVVRDNLGYNEYHDEESTPEESGTRMASPEFDDESLSRPSTAPRSTLLPSSRKIDAEDDGPQEPGYSVVDKRTKTIQSKTDQTEHVYSTPKPVSQIQKNIQSSIDHERFKKKEIGKDSSGGFIPGTSLPKFLPPPRPQLPFMSSPKAGPTHKTGLPSISHLHDEQQWQKRESNEMELPSQVEESHKIDRSISTTSRGSSVLESTSGGQATNNGMGRLRRRFHDLLDDAFSLIQGQKPSDKVTPLATPFLVKKSRSRSAMPQTRPRLLDDLEADTKSESAKTQTHFRPWSAAAVVHSPRETLSIFQSGESTDVSPRSAWGEQGRSITPVNLPTRGVLYERPDSAPLGRGAEGIRSPTPIDPETGLRMCDPAVPLIRAIKDELNRFKSTVNTDSSNT